MLVISGTDLAIVVKQIIVNMVNFNLNTFPFEALCQKKRSVYCPLRFRLQSMSKFSNSQCTYNFFYRFGAIIHTKANLMSAISS